MLGQEPTRAPEAGVVRHAALGQGQLFTAGTSSWAAFNVAFTPTGDKVTVLIDVRDGRVHSSDVDWYREIEATYTNLVPEIVKSVCSRISTTEEAVKKGFKLDIIDIRGHIRPQGCVLHYRTDRGDFEFDWYARVSRDYRIEFCGERD
jgi:(2Fe-2S) ferredoxin